MLDTVIAKLDTDIKNASKMMTKQEAHFLVQKYYELQNNRIRSGNRLFQVENSNKPSLLINWLSEQDLTLEKRVGKMLDYFSGNTSVGMWARANKGIGPIISAALISMIDITKAPTAGHIWSYAGIHGNSYVWMDKPATIKAIREVVPQATNNEYILTNEDLLEVGMRFNRRVQNLAEYFERNPDKQRTVNELSVFLARPPFNQHLKTLTWKIGESFVKIQNSEGGHYGLLILQRKQYETEKNERGEYKEQAEKALASKNWDKSTPTYKTMIEGKLSKGHIHERSKRWAVKIFLSHLHHALYLDHYKTAPVRPYAIAHLEHKDYIAPFIPFEEYIK